MTDRELIELYDRRDESAVKHTKQNYGRLLAGLARNFLRSEQDVEECVDDVLLAVWNNIPPDRPENFTAYLCRIAKNLAIKRLRDASAQKRVPEAVTNIDELYETLSAGETPESAFDLQLTAGIINRFIGSLTGEKRYMFVRRYWYGDSVKDIAAALDESESKVKTALFRLRKDLAKELRKEGITE